MLVYSLSAKIYSSSGHGDRLTMVTLPWVSILQDEPGLHPYTLGNIMPKRIGGRRTLDFLPIVRRLIAQRFTDQMISDHLGLPFGRVRYLRAHALVQATA